MSFSSGRIPNNSGVPIISNFRLLLVGDANILSITKVVVHTVSTDTEITPLAAVNNYEDAYGVAGPVTYKYLVPNPDTIVSVTVTINYNAPSIITRNYYQLDKNAFYDQISFGVGSGDLDFLFPVDFDNSNQLVLVINNN